MAHIFSENTPTQDSLSDYLSSTVNNCGSVKNNFACCLLCCNATHLKKNSKVFTMVFVGSSWTQLLIAYRKLLNFTANSAALSIWNEGCYPFQIPRSVKHFVSSVPIYNSGISVLGGTGTVPLPGIFCVPYRILFLACVCKLVKLQ
jgi:hypothetical protein